MTVKWNPICVKSKERISVHMDTAFTISKQYITRNSNSPIVIVRVKHKGQTT